MDLLNIFALVSGTLFVTVEMFHSKWTMPLEIISCLPQLYIFLEARAWGNASLQAVYIIMAVAGIFLWRKDAEKADGMVLNRMSRRSLVISLSVILCGWVALWAVFGRSGNVCPPLDSLQLALGLVGTWWLTRSYIEQWYIWIVVDIIQTVICIIMGNTLMAVLSAIYLAAAVAGLLIWRRKGIYV